MRRLLLFVLFIVCLGLGVLANQAGRYREVYRAICDITLEHFYKADMRLENWVRACRFHAARVPAWMPREQLMRSIQDHMNEMTVSHFQIYDPYEDRRLWTGVSIDTGIRSRYVEDFLVVYKVLPGSAGEEAGVKVGDEIRAMEGTPQVTPWGARNRSGKFVVVRGGEELTLTLAARSFQTDSRPRLEDLGGGTALLELQSFRSEFFAREEWRQLAARFKPYRHVIVDLRENAGGNFVAMLRALSSFHCGGVKIGELVQPRKELPDKATFDDDTADLYQIRELETYRSIGLRTFNGYGCYRGRVTVLTGPETSSVSEIFAESFFRRPNSRVWGQPTAGDVVLAVWYDIPMLGPGFSVSIPEAVYLTSDKKEIEGSGVFPQRELYYDLKTSLAGKDSWVEAARR